MMQNNIHIGLDNNAHYLHFRYRFGFVDNFTAIYKAYIARCKADDIDLSFDKTESFFQKFIKLMGLEAEFKTRTIDPRTFELEIITFRPYDKSPSNNGVEKYECISAGQLMIKAPCLISIIAKDGFKMVRLILHKTKTTNQTYKLTLREEV